MNSKPRPKYLKMFQEPSLMYALGFLLFHIPLGMILLNAPKAISVIYTLGITLLGFYYAGRKSKHFHLICVMAYIVGIEVIWRKSNYGILFYEYGKYVVSALIIVAISRRATKDTIWPLLYFLLLIPSAVANLDVSNPKMRGLISFNLSGPFSLMLGVLFFRRFPITMKQLSRIFLMFAGPCVSLAFIITTNYQALDVGFYGDSNIELTQSVGGPNQVSSALAFGGFTTMLYLINIQRQRRFFVPLLIVVAGLLLSTSAFTFSRGGVYISVGALVLGSFFFIRNPKLRMRFMGMFVVFLVIAVTVIIPKLDSITGGKLTERFAEKNVSNRGELIMIDLELWLENPIFGVGLVNSQRLRGGKLGVGYSSAHTEFTRLISEHGTFGLFALIVLCIMATRFVTTGQDSKARAFSAAFIFWAFLYMMTNAMRLAAPSFIFALAAARYLEYLPTKPNSSAQKTIEIKK